MIRTAFRLAVIVCAFTVFSLVNTALSWHLPLPDLLPHSEPTPPCVLPGAPAGPPASTTAYGQPAGFGDLIPDLPSAMGKVQGQLLHKLDGPLPSQAKLHGMASAVGHGAARWFASFRAAANGHDDPASVAAYQAEKRAAFAAQNATSCNPCNPRADGSQDPSRQAGYSTAAGTTRLDAQQRAVAGTILAVGRARGVPARGQVVALAAALQESGLRNLSYGDRDSVGVFQQRAGWGSTSARMDPATAAGAFYAHLVAVPGWQTMPVTAAAQAVQRSAYPGAYARWQASAEQIVADAGGAQLVAGGMECAALTTTYKTGAGQAWGPPGGPVYRNGQIPASALAHPATAPRALFRPDAAAAFDRMSAAYRARFGRDLAVTDSYRSYAAQVSTKAAKPGLAAEPGTSNHGWGLAADLGGGVERFGTPQHDWVAQNGPRFGWSFPAWAQRGGSRPESWHAEFSPVGSST